MNKKAFTLTELLVILVLIGVLLTITVPMILNVLNESNKKAFLDTAYTINKAASNYYASTAINDTYPLPLYITYDKDGIHSTYDSGNDNTNYLKYHGKHPDSGNIIIKVNGDIEIAIYDNRSGSCVRKAASEKTPEISEDSKEECKLDSPF